MESRRVSAGATTNELCVKVQISIQFRAFQSNINHNEPLELDLQTSAISISVSRSRSLKKVQNCA